jgi:O-methyltransferase
MNHSTSFHSLYLDLLKKTLVDFHNIGSYELHPLPIVNANWKTGILYPLDKLLRKRNFTISKLIYVREEDRLNGYDWPAQAKTMIGLNRLNNIESCIHSILTENIPGDFLEAGVWRGGATILMRAILKEQKITSRKVWLADSFQGLPKPDTAKYNADRESTLYREKILSVGIDEVKKNFMNYGLLDEQVMFLPGWFKNTLPDAPVKQLSLLRIDADMYESTIQVLENLYPKLSPGGYVIVDDYNAFPNCKQAVDDYRNSNQVNEPIVEIDKEAIYWRINQ